MSTNRNVFEDHDALHKTTDACQPEQENPPASASDNMQEQVQSRESPKVLTVPASESSEPSPLGRSTGRRGTGPRTSAGKARSSRNSLKSGNFADAVLLDGESRERYSTSCNSKNCENRANRRGLSRNYLLRN